MAVEEEKIIRVLPDETNSGAEFIVTPGCVSIRQKEGDLGVLIYIDDFFDTVKRVKAELKRMDRINRIK